MALPMLHSEDHPSSSPDSLSPNPASREHRGVLAAARRLNTAKRRQQAEDARRPATAGAGTARVAGVGVGAGGAGATTTTTTTAAAAAAAPLRRQSLRRVKDSTEELRRTTTRQRGTSNATNESTATSTTTNGRSFTVANINHGIIYLRPIVRAGNQRSRPLQDPFVFPPQTPPDSATLDSTTLSNDWEHAPYSPRTPPRTELASAPPLPEVKTDDDFKLQRPAHFTSPPRPIAHSRSRSYSTVGEHTVSSQGVEPGSFKVVIDRAPFQRPKTADTGSLPILEVPIPSYRLGTPRFSARGTAILRSSLYTRSSDTDDRKRSSFLTPQRANHSFLSSRPRSDVCSPIPVNYCTTMDHIPLQPSTAPSSARVSKVPIGPQLYDALTASPDDQAVVRFSTSGEILAATPSRLIAHITSPSFLDYELLSDFFLTFRSFLNSRDLAAYLISRLRWAVNRQDDFGRIVRVRTFVALRHWILNYFVDDYVPTYQLRAYFCELVNTLYKDLRARDDGGGGDVKIVGELKKCWRRTCALYWDGEQNVGRDLAEDDLLPGGHVEPQAFVEENMPQQPPLPSTPPRQTDRATKVETIGSNPSDQFASRYMDWAQKARHTPQNSYNSPYVLSQAYEATQVPLSPASEQSMQVISCSIPMRGLGRSEPASDMPLYPHPVPHPVPARFAASPQNVASAKQRNRPSYAHKRSGSFSDALRDHREPLSVSKGTATDVPVSMVSKMPGSLVRGGLFQPSSPYVDLNAGLRHTRSHLEFVDPVDVSPTDANVRQPYATNPGMKKLFGSVRRALSTKQPSAATSQLQVSAFRQHVAQSTRSSNPASVSTTTSGGVYRRRNVRPRPQIRIDILAMRVGESFREAINEQMKYEQQRSNVAPALGGFEFEFEKPESTRTADQPEASTVPRPRVHSAITTGSKSILIMDDTGAPDLPFMSGALPSPKPNVPRNPDILSRPRGASIDARLAGESVPVAASPEFFEFSEQKPAPTTWRPTSRGPARISVVPQRRSLSEGRERLHSFRRRGSTKTSVARSTSLRKHASYNSGLSRHHQVGASIATFQTVSSDNDPFSLDHRPTGGGGGGGAAAAAAVATPATPATPAAPAAPAATTPARQLRRRPGGDLRAAGNIHDLEGVQRPHSTGSISNRSHSMANSVILHSDRYVEPASEPAVHIEEKQQEEVPKKKAVSLVDTHSSQPNLRPSFEAEVAKLAALPDDIDDDGGIESALMKLEGRYEKKSPETSPRSTIDPDEYQHNVFPPSSSNPSYIPSDRDSSRTKSYAKTDDVFHRPLAPPEAEGQGMYRLSSENFNRRAPVAQSAVGSEDSYSSVPLLDRGLSDIVTSSPSRTLDTMRSSAKPAPLQPTSSARHLSEQITSANSSIEYIIETESMRRIPRDGTLPRASFAHESFLLEDGEDLSGDDHSGMHSRSDQTSHGVRSFFDDEPAVLENENGILLPHPMRHPPTPPLTATRLKDSLPQVDTTVLDRGLPTPGLTPTSRLNNQPFGNTTPVEPAMELQELKKDAEHPPPAHLPFILAYDAETLAEQFTIVEKDALDEIDWKELIELRWKQSSPQIRDWVQYLRTQEARGVDVVIARFNIVVKWAVSECVLTESNEERARCIVKYIHVAAHARRLRNYATMYQFTIALLSNDVSRLKNTWALVPAPERQTLKDLEALVQPLRNFHNLRVEMETASSEEGCIPFIGIYTRDLIYNAQKPAFIDAPPVDGERLVNFERHHTAAMIVKSLLRLLEASSKYTFKAEPKIISKCLWMAALSDEEITAISRTYE
ncbi:ras GEF [Pleomassaria siparia CBS 279.74]|uniref:Ras GEF n=1 Tax=Pleomassaria siparia CBS 279.74 TaxID=1314801 RepID=A0A6G1KG18_9PLEO|nr:ras GEF [Pleomassaria siparia CBS 279.74]